MAEHRRYPPPWEIEDNGACFIVRDHGRQALAYLYYENEPGHRAAANLLTRNEARRIAINIAKPPEPLNVRVVLGPRPMRRLTASSLVDHFRQNASASAQHDQPARTLGNAASIDRPGNCQVVMPVNDLLLAGAPA
jgi:hypothetical protein